MQTDGIIFDVDGTLWDATVQIVEAYNDLLKDDDRIPYTITLQDMIPMMGLMNEDIAKHLFPHLPDNERNALMDSCCQHECEYLEEHGGILYPEVVDVLETLAKHYALYIVSNCQDGYIEVLFKNYPIAHLFKDYECSGHTGLSKAENLKLIVARNALRNPVYIGDTQKDKDSCILANIPFIYASYGFGEVDKYEYSITKIHDLLTIFQP